MNQYIKHVSQLDRSVNFERTFTDHTGRLEARFVQRDNDYFIIYLSSQTGCKQACRMCWLTQTGQTDSRDVTMEEYLEQAGMVFQHYAELCRNNVVGSFAKRVHFNFMARGEPLANKHFLENADEILRRLRDMALSHGLESKFLISTIYPKEMKNYMLGEIFRDPEVYPEIYYSIYSTNPAFRRKWLPKATKTSEAIFDLSCWQEQTGKKPKIHYAFIHDENDTLADVKNICDALDEFKLDVNWNVVRYNPPVGHNSKEAIYGQIEYLAGYVRRRYPNARVKIIPRVGTDVKASCGTFLS